MSQQGQPEQIDRDYVRLLMVMRRFIRDEFAHNIPISEPDAAVRLLDYAGRSRNKVLQEMAIELRAMLSPEVNESALTAAKGETTKVHCYRGVTQPVAVATTETVDTTPQSGRATRIYRGRVVAS